MVLGTITAIDRVHRRLVVGPYEFQVGPEAPLESLAPGMVVIVQYVEQEGKRTATEVRQTPASGSS